MELKERKLREWTSPDGKKWVWDKNQRQWALLPDMWPMTARYYADQSSEHRAALDDLRENPHEPEPEVVWEGCRITWNGRLFRLSHSPTDITTFKTAAEVASYIADGDDDLVDQLRALQGRERPALADLDAETLVGELVRRGVAKTNSEPFAIWVHGSKPSHYVYVEPAPERAR